MSQDNALAELATLKQTRNRIAVRHGLTPIGTAFVNQHGIEWVVDGHFYASTLPSIAHRHRSGEEDPRDLYPVLIPQNFSPRLHAFVAETDRCTSKWLMFLDTLPFLRPQYAHPEGHWVDGLTSPERILIFLDAERAHETVVAHEIGHIWIDVVEDCEDHRMLKDLSNTAKVFQWTHLQSFVLDRKVNEVLRERGFDLSVVENEIKEALDNFTMAILTGFHPPNAREAEMIASTLATAMLDYETGAAETLQTLDVTSMVLEQFLPDVYELACGLAASVRKHGYSDRASIRRAINECAELSFAFVGEPIDLENDLVDETPTECFFDKHPEEPAALTVPGKLEIARLMARLRIEPGTRCELSYNHDGRVHAQFLRETGEWTSPVVLKYVPRLPNDVSFRGLHNQTQRGRNPMNKPTTPPFPRPGHDPRRRTYSPGLARFLSQVRLAEQLGGEHPYAYAMNNPVNYIDPSGNLPSGHKSKRPRKPDPILTTPYDHCLSLSPGACYWCVYPIMMNYHTINPNWPVMNSPKQGCEITKSICNTNINCDSPGAYPPMQPCSPGNDVPIFGFVITIPDVTPWGCVQHCREWGVDAQICRKICFALEGKTCDQIFSHCLKLPYPDNDTCVDIWLNMCHSKL